MNATRRRLLLALALLIASAALVVLGQAGMMASIQDLSFRALAGTQHSIETAFFNLRDFLTAPRNLQALIERNSELELQVAEMEAEMVTLREEASEVDVLRALLGTAREQPENQYLVAQVIGRDTSPFLRYLILDQGSNSGIQAGMPVVSQNGLVGRISEVTATASKVQLIVDPSSSVNARIQDSQTEGVLVGRSTGDLEMIYIPQDAVVKPGDIVVTSGLGGGFPADILIGSIISVHRRDYEFYQSAVIEPRSDFSTLELLLIITNFAPFDVAPLTGGNP